MALVSVYCRTRCVCAALWCGHDVNTMTRHHHKHKDAKLAHGCTHAAKALAVETIAACTRCRHKLTTTCFLHLHLHLHPHPHPHPHPRLRLCLYVCGCYDHDSDGSAPAHV